MSYELALTTEFIGTQEYWYFKVTCGNRVALIPCEGAVDFGAQALADRIGRFLESLDGDERADAVMVDLRMSVPRELLSDHAAFKLWAGTSVPEHIWDLATRKGKGNAN